MSCLEPVRNARVFQLPTAVIARSLGPFGPRTARQSVRPTPLGSLLMDGSAPADGTCRRIVAGR